jgi:transcriptional regulator with XRE-family HTH domain
MTVADRRLQLADRQLRRICLDAGDELRQARLNAGLDQEDVARAVGCSAATISRVERGITHQVTLGHVIRHASVVGLVTRLRLYPAGDPIRDSAQVQLLEDLRARLSPRWKWRTEVPMPLPGDLRALDALASIGGCRVAIDAFTRLGDTQAQTRSSLLKSRDVGATRLVILVRAGHANRTALQSAREGLRGSFPLGTRRVLAALAQGRDPGGNGIVLL